MPMPNTKMKGLGTMRLKQKFPLLVTAIAVTVAMIFISTIIVINLQKTDAAIINLVGRQRMLSQKITKEALSCVLAASSKQNFTELAEQLKSSREIFSSSMQAFANGGDVPATLDITGPKQHCPQPSQEIKELLKNASVAWDELSAILDKSAAAGWTDMGLAGFLYQKSDDVLKTSEALVKRVQKESETRTAALLAIQIVGVIISSICLFIIMIAVYSFVHKLGKVNTLMQTYGKGDLTRRIEVKTRADELDDTLFEVNRLGENIASIIGEIYATNTTLLKVTNEFANAFSNIASNADTMKKRSHTVAAATEESSSTIMSISASAEEMSATVKTVALAMEQMGATINEIAQNCQKELTVVTNAQKKGALAQDIINRLGTTASEIGKIIGVISDIADRTNMLSLNATIEAASAGEAGKGFAVVANEVKELSHQTAKAADEIQERVAAMQANADESIKTLKDIIDVIEDVNSVSQVIVAAVEEQSATSSEIAKNINNGSIAANEIAHSVSETATAISEVSSNIQDVNRDITGVADSLQTARNQSKQLSDLGQNLASVVSMFKIQTDFLQWNDALSVDITEIDSQHKKLISMINDLNRAVAEGKAREAVTQVLDGLAEYTVSHFGTEEKYFKQFNFPEYEAHKKIHDTFVAKVVDARTALVSGKAMINRDIMIFLKEWLVEHIMKTDHRYGPFLRKHGIR